MQTLLNSVFARKDHPGKKNLGKAGKTVFSHPGKGSKCGKILMTIYGNSNAHLWQLLYARDRYCKEILLF